MTLITNLQSWWKFEGNSNDAVGTRNGTDTSITYGAPYGKIAQGASFNGSSSKIVVPRDAAIENTAISIQVWLKTSNAQPNRCIFADDSQTPPYNGWLLQMADDGIGHKVRFRWNGLTNDLDSTIALDDGAWHHIVITVSALSGGTINMYIDGALNATRSTSGTLVYSGKNPTFGTFADANVNFFTGYIDEAAIWSRALTLAEVQSLYNSGAGITYPFSNAYAQSLVETVTLVDNVKRGAGKYILDAFTLVDAVKRGAGKYLLEAVTLVDTMKRATTRTLIDSVTLVASFTSTFVYVKAITDSIALVDSIKRDVGKQITETVALVDTMYKAAARTLAETITMVDTQTIHRFYCRTLEEVIDISDTIQKATARLLTETLSLVDTVRGLGTIHLTETITLVDVVAKVRQATKVLTETISLNDAIARAVVFGRHLTESISLTDRLRGLRNGLNMLYNNKYANKAVTYIKKYIDPK